MSADDDITGTFAGLPDGAITTETCQSDQAQLRINYTDTSVTATGV